MNNSNHLQEIILNYKALTQGIDKIISKSPIRISHLSKKLGLGRTAFYNKRRNKSFTLKEMEILINELSKFDDYILQ